MRSLAGAFLAAVITMASVACSGPEASSDGAVEPGMLAAGADLYQANCALCHGVDLRGTDTGPSLLSIVYEPGHHPDAAFFLAVVRGSPAHHWNFGDMPPVVGLTTEDIEAIVAFIRDRQRTEGFEPYPP